MGATRRLLKVRANAHRGVSFRTGVSIKNPEFSSIRNHTKTCKHKICYEDFEILGKATNSQKLAILESLFIKQTVPQLNNQTTATPLYLS